MKSTMKKGGKKGKPGKCCGNCGGKKNCKGC
jgi:hypothetical protein